MTLKQEHWPALRHVCDSLCGKITTQAEHDLSSDEHIQEQYSQRKQEHLPVMRPTTLHGMIPHGRLLGLRVHMDLFLVGEPSLEPLGKTCIRPWFGHLLQRSGPHSRWIHHISCGSPDSKNSWLVQDEINRCLFESGCRTGKARQGRRGANGTAGEWMGWKTGGE